MKADEFKRTIRQQCKAYGVKGDDLDHVTQQLITVFLHQHARIVKQFVRKVNTRILISADVQAKNEAIVDCIRIIAKETGLSLSEYTTAEE